MNQDQIQAGIDAGTIQPRISYTYADLLAKLQKLNDQQLQQQVWGWDENQTYDQLSVRVLEEDYVSDGESYAPESDCQKYATPEELADIKTWSRMPKGTVVFDIGG